jgi:hypothetical protein
LPQHNAAEYGQPTTPFYRLALIESSTHTTRLRARTVARTQESLSRRVRHPNAELRANQVAR